ncbi:type II toxin-antitoxin system PemK/MazF family toxin [Streptomyces sp. NPDC058758]|uniref:type II toxin-antitoxin system PemK/MazF family toxin n=1 Tax=Streptomyces sp. NPDC058758 TaxID=3346627 RepID=UPI00369EB924
MRRGEVWWAVFDERRPVVLLSDEEPSGFRAVQVVAPAGVDLGDLGVEVPVGPPEGLPFDGVLRWAFPRPGFTPCTWTTTVTRDDLTERAGALSPARLDAAEAALRRAARPTEWTPTAAAGFDALKTALRRGAVDG